jgi:hypothetical protein
MGATVREKVGGGPGPGGGPGDLRRRGPRAGDLLRAQVPHRVRHRHHRGRHLEALRPVRPRERLLADRLGPDFKDMERDGQRGAGEDGGRQGRGGSRDEAEGVIPLQLKGLKMTNISGRGTPNASHGDMLLWRNLIPGKLKASS